MLNTPREGLLRAFLFPMNDISQLEAGAVHFRERLLRVAERHLHPMLLQRISAEDLLQEMFHRAAQRSDFLTHAPEVPLYFKLRHLLLQTLADAERRHLKAHKRDLFRELPIDLSPDATSDDAPPLRDSLPAEISSPFTKTARADRYALLKQILESLPATDRHILILRHFDNCSNAECAATLNISEKAASLRYVRALTRLHEHLARYTEFQTP